MNQEDIRAYEQDKKDRKNKYNFHLIVIFALLCIVFFLGYDLLSEFGLIYTMSPETSEQKLEFSSIKDMLIKGGGALGVIIAAIVIKNNRG